MSKHNIGLDILAAGFNAVIRMFLCLFDMSKFFTYPFSRNISYFFYKIINRTALQSPVRPGDNGFYCITGFQSCIWSAFTFAVNADKGFKEIHISKFLCLFALL